MPIIHANILKGRSAEAKSAFARDVSEAAVHHLGVKLEQVRVLIHEVEPEHWVVGGVARKPLG